MSVERLIKATCRTRLIRSALFRVEHSRIAWGSCSQKKRRPRCCEGFRWNRCRTTLKLNRLHTGNNLERMHAIHQSIISRLIYGSGTWYHAVRVQYEYYLYFCPYFLAMMLYRQVNYVTSLPCICRYKFTNRFAMGAIVVKMDCRLLSNECWWDSCCGLDWKYLFYRC